MGIWVLTVQFLQLLCMPDIFRYKMLEEKINQIVIPAKLLDAT